MKLGVICDGISRDLTHAVKVMDEFSLKYAELQFVGDKEVGDHSPDEISDIKKNIGRFWQASVLPLTTHICRYDNEQPAWRRVAY
jgi:hypothetical protein